MPTTINDGAKRVPYQKGKDPLPTHLRRAVSLIHQMHEAVDRGERGDSNEMHQLLDEAERAVVTDASLPPRQTPDPAPEYQSLRKVLRLAFEQAAFGKGKDRHANRAVHPFVEQPICELQRLFSSDYAFGQACKKMEESKRLPKEQALAELLGAINYIAAAYIVREEQDETGPSDMRF